VFGSFAFGGGCKCGSGCPRFETTDSFAMLSFGFVSVAHELKEIGLYRLRKRSLLGQKSLPSGALKSLRENAVPEEGHGFSRAVNDTAIPGFSR
jgi:hypothetical protein